MKTISAKSCLVNGFRGIRRCYPSRLATLRLLIPAGNSLWHTLCPKGWQGSTFNGTLNGPDHFRGWSAPHSQQNFMPKKPKKKIIRKRKAKKRAKRFLKLTITPELKQGNKYIEIDAGIGFDAGLGSDAWLINQSRSRGKK